MDPKSWKDYLLSSGLPLEYSVMQALDLVGIHNYREFTYERINESAILSLFSVDLYATHIYGDGNLWLELFIECKYRHDNVRWVFVPEKTEFPYAPQLRNCFILLDELSRDRMFNGTLLDKFTSHYDFCVKGVELLAKDTNPKAIEQSIQQLRFALAHKFIDAIRHQALSPSSDKPTPLFAFVPIVVTTSKLWRLNAGVTIDQIKQANQLEEVASERDLIIVRQDPDMQLTRHAERVFERGINGPQSNTIHDRLNPQFGAGYYGLLHKYSRAYPSQFVIIQFQKFESAIRNLISFFGQEDIIRPR